MATTYTKIASVTVGSGGASSIDFSSIPATYTDLKIVYSTRDTQAGASAGNLKITINGSTTGYTNKKIIASGSSVGSSSSGTAFMDGGLGQSATSAGNTANTFYSADVYFPNYLSSNNKTSSVDSVDENNATAAYSGITANLWSNTAAITQITATAQLLFAQYSSATLYGIKNS